MNNRTEAQRAHMARVQELRRSGAAGPQNHGRRRQRTRATVRRAALRDQ
jgi:hypothetical protein